MARVVILGAGISGHTAALHLRRMLDARHEVVVVSPKADWNWIPSNIWVGVGRMTGSQVTFPLAPVYAKKGIDFRQAKTVALHPEGDGDQTRGSVDVVYTLATRDGERERVEYDYLINATGPKLNFAATPGLGPDGHTLSVCTAEDAELTAESFAEVIRKLKRGERQTLVIGVGHGTCTCEGQRSSTRSTSSTNCGCAVCASMPRSSTLRTSTSSVTSVSEGCRSSRTDS